MANPTSSDEQWLQQVTSLAQQPWIEPVLNLHQSGVQVTPDLIQKIATAAAKPQPFSKGLTAVPAPTGGVVIADAATREVIPPSNIVMPPKPAPGSMGYRQEQLPDGTFINFDAATGEKVVGEKPAQRSDGQNNALMFGHRMRQAEEELSKITPKNFDPTSTLVVGMMPERMKTEGRQRYEAAAGNWISALLRKESGAAIGEDEYAQAWKQYFPLPGEEKSSIEQKARLRGLVMKDMDALGGQLPESRPQQPAATQPATQPAAAQQYPVGTRARRGNQWFMMTPNGWQPE